MYVVGINRLITKKDKNAHKIAQRLSFSSYLTRLCLQSSELPPDKSIQNRLEKIYHQRHLRRFLHPCEIGYP